MTDKKDLADLSDEEVREFAGELATAMPEVFSKVLGLDFDEEIGDEEIGEFSGRVEEILLSSRDAMRKESENEQAVAMFDIYNEIVGEIMGKSDQQEETGDGFDLLVEQLQIVLKGSREGMEELGYVEYFDLMDEFAIEIVDSGHAGSVNDFFSRLSNDSQQMLLQRMMNPVITEYYEYFEKHPEIQDADEARRYAEVYYELSELVGNLLPQFIAVLQIVSDREETYDELKQMGLNNLIQKLRSKKYSRFNGLADGINRKLRNSIGHRDFLVDPVEKEIKFHDRGEQVAVLKYSEFQDEVFRLLALFNAVWVFRLMLKYYQIQHLPNAIDELRDS